MQGNGDVGKGERGTAIAGTKEASTNGPTGQGGGRGSSSVQVERRRGGGAEAEVFREGRGGREAGVEADVCKVQEQKYSM